jgi:HlyD family secretion protein
MPGTDQGFISSPRRRIALAVLVAAAAGAFYVLRDNSDSGTSIRVSGNIEVTEAEVSFKIPGRVVERLASEGTAVQKGGLVAKLESTELELEVAARQADVNAAAAALAELEAGSRPEEIAQAEAVARAAEARLQEALAGSRPEEVKAAEAAVRQASAEEQRARAEYERFRNLREEGVISAQQFDTARSAFETAGARLEAAQEQLALVRQGPRVEEVEQARAAAREAAERYALVKAGPRKEVIAQARARLEQARQALASAETRLSYAALLSPLSGVVLSENVEPGEYVAAGTPVITVAELATVWLRAYIEETDVGRVKLGQHARVMVDSFPDKTYEGRVSFISSEAEFTPKTVQTERERVKLVYRIKIDIANPEMELKPGMPADAEIDLTAADAQTTSTQ